MPAVEKNRKNLLPKKKKTVMMRLNVLVPSGQWALEAVFAAGCDCQAWRPAPEDEHRDSYDGQEHMTKSGGHRYMLYV